MNYQVLLTEMLQGTLMTLRIFFSTLVFALPKGSANTKVEKKIRRVISVPCSISVSNT